VRRSCWYLTGLLVITLLAACTPGQGSQLASSQPLPTDALHQEQRPTPTPIISIPRQIATLTPTPTRKQTLARFIQRHGLHLGNFLLHYWAHALTLVLGLIVCIALLIPFLSYL